MALKLLPLDARIPQWDFDRLTERNCPVCSSSDAHAAYVKRPDGLSVRICRKCNAFFVSPSPSEEQLDAFYRDYDEKHRRASRKNWRLCMKTSPPLPIFEFEN